MKRSVNRLLAPFLLALLAPFYAYSQGSVWFNNIEVSQDDAVTAPVTIRTQQGTFNPADGLAGAYVGADYTASLYFLNGTVTDQAMFDNSNPILFPSANTSFFGTTGSDGSDGSGLFDGGIPYLTSASGQSVTIQVRAWYNGGGLYTSYDQSLAAGQNVGEANPVSVFLAQGTFPPPSLYGLLPFTVGIVPEPSIYALLCLGGLLLLHRQKIT